MLTLLFQKTGVLEIWSKVIENDWLRVIVSFALRQLLR